MKNIKIVLPVAIFIMTVSNSFGQVSKKETAVSKVNTARVDTFVSALKQVTRSTAHEISKHSDSLNIQNMINYNRLVADYETDFKKLYSARADSLNEQRRDTLQNSYNTLIPLIVMNEVLLKNIANNLIVSTTNRLESKIKNLLLDKSISAGDRDGFIESFSEAADSLKWFAKDSCSNYFSTLSDQMSDRYYLARDSIETICSMLMDNQITENELIAEQKSAIADSLAEIKADSLRYYNGRSSFYNSFSYGFDRNPLYYYEKPGDQIIQWFTQALYKKNFLSSSFNVAYMGTLIMFNKFTNRNYYDHSLNAQYRFDLKDENDRHDLIKAWENEEEFTVEKFTTLTLGLKPSARYDKNYYKDYNNNGVELTADYKNRADSTFIYSFKNTLGYRNYTIIGELSNITDVLEFQVAKVTPDGFRYGLSFSAGIKYYTKTIYDTTIFTVGGQGKNKNIKQISLKPQSNGSYQLIFGLLGSKKTTAFSFESSLLYRYNLNTQYRFLGMYVNTTFLSEDIYNESFAYQGPEAKISWNYELPLGIQLNTSAEVQYKKMNLPAFNLQGDQVKSNRIDLRSYAECGFSKYFEIAEGLSADFTFTFSVLRNQSNDAYNDYSSYTASISAGIGF